MKKESKLLTLLKHNSKNYRLVGLEWHCFELGWLKGWKGLEFLMVKAYSD